MSFDAHHKQTATQLSAQTTIAHEASSCLVIINYPAGVKHNARRTDTTLESSRNGVEVVSVDIHIAIGGIVGIGTPFAGNHLVGSNDDITCNRVNLDGCGIFDILGLIRTQLTRSHVVHRIADTGAAIRSVISKDNLVIGSHTCCIGNDLSDHTIRVAIHAGMFLCIVWSRTIYTIVEEIEARTIDGNGLGVADVLVFQISGLACSKIDFRDRGIAIAVVRVGHIHDAAGGNGDTLGIEPTWYFFCKAKFTVSIAAT